MTKKLYFEIFPDNQKILFDKLSDLQWLANFYLAGGTCLALQMGHRQSIDFDFFSPDSFNTRDMIHNLTDIGKFELFTEAENTINGSLNNVNISFLKYKYPLLEETIKIRNIELANMLDVAAMKLEAISGRGSKKDFIDLYYLLNLFSIKEIFSTYEKKYESEIVNHYHLLKSLVYFDDADSTPMPVMMENIAWQDIKKSIVNKIKNVTF